METVHAKRFPNKQAKQAERQPVFKFTGMRILCKKPTGTNKKAGFARRGNQP